RLRAGRALAAPAHGPAAAARSQSTRAASAVRPIGAALPRSEARGAPEGAGDRGEAGREGVSCPLCRERKGKRHCPAKAARICSACCGSKRLVEIDCPRDCAFLTGAHAGAWDGRETERARDQRRLAPSLEGLSDAQAQLLLLAVVGLDRLRSERRELEDRLAQQAVAALRKTVETRGHGILY